ncbi:putative membrane protein [Paenibacillus uliginis N3/975]|uniref:Putative membrane protein n=1 Tax=Paenibacillus uliginis N3/975 TaxID=1313296 RepID=A0A1X7GWI3_9BACL|nr:MULTISPECIES: DUF350 domain-containing protein [Paenibacillus]UNK17439.1 DUF350 domain-containing protein [Paenibacillus sp. N3/727]SMF75018.1 putative membrane protein [Paenibacillus uliginis N3/975]
MMESIDQLLEHPVGVLVGYFSVAILALIVYLACFEVVTKYNCWDEIRKGNVAAAMATGGKIFGICNVMRYSIESNTSVYDMIKWSFLGFILLLAAYLLLEFLTPVFSVDEEIGKDNRAVGLIVLIITVSLSYVIGASIM